MPKSDGSRRPISIPNWSDKLVQEVIRMILEAYYEPQFRDSSHGFRPNRGCHTALQQIKRSWTGTKWFIEGDIQGCFDNIQPETVHALLRRQIHDNRFLRLVKEMMYAGYMDDWIYHKTYSGVPQGGIVSPILSNVVLNELDRYVEDILIPQYTQGQRRKHNPEYYRLGREKYRAEQNGDVALYRQLSRQQRQLPEGDPNDPGYKRLRYLRYADDFVLGLIGSKADAEDIKAQLGRYLKQLNLTLSEEKTSITHARSQAARFLGYDITTTWDNNRMTKQGTKKGRTRSLNGTIRLSVPKDVRTKWIRRYSQRNEPHAIGGYIELSDYEIVETYGAQLRGLVNYYALATNLGTSLSQVRWACMESARKTLAAKHKISSPRMTYTRYYHAATTLDEWRHIRITVERDGKTPLVAKCGETPLRTRKIAYTKDQIPPKVIAGTTSELLTRLQQGKCELCGQTAELEAHHVNKLKDLRKRWQGKQEKPPWVQNMIARRRKTIVICHDCHQAITHGRYDGPRPN